MSVLGNTIKSDINMGEEVIRDFLKNYISLSIFDATGVSNNINNMNNAITRNLARGLAYYFADEITEDIQTSNSNLREMSVRVLVDDTLFDAVKSFAMESLYDTVDDTLGGFVPTSLNRERVVSTAMMTVMDSAGKKLGIDHPLKNLGSLVGFV